MTGRPAAETPQVWALYKEVQEYYDQGMRVPDDVTLLFADDNWGNVRRLPEPGADAARRLRRLLPFRLCRRPAQLQVAQHQPDRAGVGADAPGLRHGADRLWIVNVGDIKPMEFPTSFFLDYAWNPRAMAARAARRVSLGLGGAPVRRQLCRSDRRDRHKLQPLAARRKPELLGPETYSLVEFDEADRVAREWGQLPSRAERIEAALPPEYRDAYFQVVLHPIQAFGNLHALYRAVALNRSTPRRAGRGPTRWPRRRDFCSRATARSGGATKSGRPAADGRT